MMLTIDNRNSSYLKYLALIDRIHNTEREQYITRVENQLNRERQIIVSFSYDFQRYFTNIKEKESNITSRFIESIVRNLGDYSSIENGLAEPFKIFVVGIGNAGKSSVINSLIGTGEEYAAVKSLPQTWKIDIYNSHLKDGKVRMLFKDGHTELYSPEKAKEIIAKEEKEIKESKSRARKLFKAKIKEGSYNIDERSELKLKIDRENIIKSDITEVHWPVPSNKLLDKVILVDTPGFDQDNYSNEVKNNAQDYYKKAEGVLWLLDATTINASGSKKLLEELDNINNKISDSRTIDDKVAVLNFIDRVEADKEEVVAEAKEIYKSHFKDLIPYSAKNVFEAGKTNDLKIKKDSGYDSLISAIDNKFISNAERIKGEKNIESVSLTTQEVKQSISEFKNSLEKDLKDFDSYKTIITKRFERQEKDLINELSHAIDKHIRKVLVNLKEKLEDLYDEKNQAYSEEEKTSIIYKESELRQIISLFNNKLEAKINLLFQETYSTYNFFQYDLLESVVPIESKFIKNKFKLETVNTITFSGNENMLAGGAIGLIFGPVGGLLGAGVGAFTAYTSNRKRIYETENKIKSFLTKVSTDVTQNTELYFTQVLNESLRHLEQKLLNKYSFNEEQTYESIVDLKKICEEALISLENEHYTSYEQMFLQLISN